jgi:aminoglycoside phosphotransferase (APT) family kinase protein
VDLARFAAWFDRACPGAVTGPLRARLLAGGRSNLTYEVSDGTRSWVVCRPPLGHVLATAHDMGREYRVITALRGTEVPVPATYALCADAERSSLDHGDSPDRATRSGTWRPRPVSLGFAPPTVTGLPRCLRCLL